MTKDNQSLSEPNSSRELQKTILLIDDETEFVQFVQKLLEEEGYYVVTAAHGEEGLERLTEVSPDLIILDLYMNKMSGIEFYKRILKEGSTDFLNGVPRYPILVVTGRVYLKEVFRDLQIEGFLAKPFKDEDLLREIRRVLNKSELSKPRQESLISKPVLKILIVENDKSNFQKMAGLFVEKGHAVSGVYSAVEALERMKVETPDIVLMRYDLPDLTGEVAILRFRKIYQLEKLPVILYDEDSYFERIKMKQIPNLIRGISLVPSADPKEILKVFDNLILESRQGSSSIQKAS